jgi:hypothetical protein
MYSRETILQTNQRNSTYGTQYKEHSRGKFETIFPIIKLSIGSFACYASYEDQIVFRIDKPNLQLNIECMEFNGCKRLELDFFDVINIGYEMKNDYSVIHMQVARPPRFAMITKDSKWVPISDFTSYQASTSQTFSMLFSAAATEALLQKLKQSHPRFGSLLCGNFNSPTCTTFDYVRYLTNKFAN